MKKFALLIVPALLIAVLILPAVGNSEKAELPKYSTTVKLNITAGKEITNEVYSYISRELRSIGDVKLVEDNPDWVIQVVAGQAKNNTGNIGLAFSVVVERKMYRAPMLFEIVKAVLGINPKELKETKYINLEKAIITMTADYNSEVRAHWLRLDGTEYVQRICKGIVADFDTEHLKIEREMHENEREMYEKNIKKLETN